MGAEGLLMGARTEGVRLAEPNDGVAERVGIER